MKNINLIGASELKERLSKLKDMGKIERVVKKHGAKLQEEAQYNAQRGVSFKKGYSKGTTKKLTRLNISDNRLTAKVGVGTEYAPHVEYGTRFMEAEPFLRPAMKKIRPKFFRDLRKAVESE